MRRLCLCVTVVLVFALVTLVSIVYICSEYNWNSTVRTIKSYIFPDQEDNLPDVGVITQQLKEAGFKIKDVERIVGRETPYRAKVQFNGCSTYINVTVDVDSKYRPVVVFKKHDMTSPPVATQSKRWRFCEINK